MLKLSPAEAALLRAVCADRDNDLPRLVYADYLDDHGRGERAEFIRLQVQAAADDSPHVRFHVQPRIDELFAAHRDRWLRELPKWAVGSPPPFVRGFLEGLSVPAASFVRYGPQLLDRTPVCWLRLEHPGGVWAEAVRCGWLGEAPHLQLMGGGLDDDHIAALVGAGWLTGIRRLYLGFNRLRDPAARALAGCRHLRGLDELDLTHNDLTVAGVQTMLASTHLSGCTLRLGGNPRLDADRHVVARLLGPRGTL